jgi:ribosomal protein S18 acetylase RimI-like enzyme
VTEVEVRPLAGDDHDALRAFFLRVPEGDRTFFREDVLADGVIERWIGGAAGERFVAARDGDVVGYLALIAGVGWSSHVGELRVVVDPTRRRSGVGRALARAGLLHGLDRGLTKLVVEVVADQEPTLAMFSALGFEAEALLRDHVRDGSGQLRDLIVLAHFVDATWDTMRTIGLDDVVSS